MAAAAAATRAVPTAVRARTPTRAAFVLLARRQGWTDPGVLARACGVTRHSIRSLARREQPDLLAAASLCLGDDRLLAPWRETARR